MNRLVFALAISVCLVSNLFAQAKTQVDYEGYSKEEIKRKVQAFTGVKNTGLTLLGVGAVSTVLGIVFVSNAKWDSYSTETSAGVTTKDPKGGAGIICLAAGIPVSITGIILAALGKRKQSEYKYRLETFGSLNDFHTNLVVDF